MIVPFLAILCHSTQEIAPNEIVKNVPIVRATESVQVDADDPAIWRNNLFPERSLILGTDKGSAPNGAVYVFGLDGKIRRKMPLDQPNNVDVEYRFQIGNRWADIAVATERGKQRLAIFSINPYSGEISDLTGETRVFPDETGDRAACMGIGLYRHSNGAIDAFVSRKTGPDGAYLGQYRLKFNHSSQRVDLIEVRRFGRFFGNQEIESIAVDDVHGMIYCSEENWGVHKYSVFPHESSDRPLANFAREGWKGDREGLAVVGGPTVDGEVIVTDQLAGNSVFRIYSRPNHPDLHTHKWLRSFSIGSDATDGIDCDARDFGPEFPNGIFVAMNSKDKNFLLVDRRAFTAGIRRARSRS